MESRYGREMKAQKEISLSLLASINAVCFRLALRLQLIVEVVLMRGNTPPVF
jgi:hypothetical protein